MRVIKCIEFIIQNQTNRHAFVAQTVPHIIEFQFSSMNYYRFQFKSLVATSSICQPKASNVILNIALQYTPEIKYSF